MIRSYSWSLGTALAALMLGPAASTSAPAQIAEPMAAASAVTAPVATQATERATFEVAPSVAAPPAPAPAPAVDGDMTARIEALNPGAFVWHPERATAGPIEIVVSIPRQIAYVYRGGQLIGATTVSTGRPGHRTPTGTFPILGHTSLMQAIALAGGTTDDANLHRIAIFRTIGGQRQAAAFDLASIRHGEAPDPQVYAGDIVIVDGSSIKQGGRWEGPIDPERVHAFTQRVAQLR